MMKQNELINAIKNEELYGLTYEINDTELLQKLLRETLYIMYINKIPQEKILGGLELEYLEGLEGLL
ncbi:MAG: hypothetical protein IKT73_07780 [Anaerotignum sp.]|nr:hypothetical protein [Anaerotignum sp.]